MKFDLGFDFRHAMPVSLFTREWIEINIYIKTDGSYAVSLFTREWIEIIYEVLPELLELWSPSLRGSGLKSFDLVA